MKNLTTSKRNNRLFGFQNMKLLSTLTLVFLVNFAHAANDPYGACCYLKNCKYWVCEEMYQSECSNLFDGTHWADKTCEEIDCPNFSVFDLGACCVEDADGGMICYFVKETDCESYGGVWYPGIPCECEPCEPTISTCEIIPSPNCVGPPQYTDPNYTVFGNGHIAIQTASTSILGGSTLMLFDLSGTLPLDTSFPLNRYSHLSWEHPNSDPAPDMGSIFGLAVDEVGNIYVTTSKTWNQDVVGTFGWGAVYKVDTNTALPELFATIPMPNNESGLGSITYDCEHSQFFVSSFEDGLIYRLDMSGNILDTYDHGTPYAGAAGPAAFSDRPWAVEVHGDRLYYSLWNENLYESSVAMKNEIWSVALDGIGAPLSATALLEISLPDYPHPKTYDWSSPVSDIDFSPEGTMFLSERTQTSFSSLYAHSSRLLEYECTSSGWMPSIELFEVGSYDVHTNTSGGVDATTHGIWATGDALHFSSGDYIYGFQGTPVTGGDHTMSVLVDFQGDITGSDKTMIGDIVVTDEDSTGGEKGACCYQDNCESHCAVMSETLCLTYFGSSFYPNTTCDNISCPPAPQDFGACCYIDAGGYLCNEMYMFNCDNVSGAWYPGIPCECIPCEPKTPTGACCFLDTDNGLMACVELSQYDCEKKPESSYAGDYTTCIDEYCCDPIGACCVSGQCLLATQTQCIAGNGVYYGNGNLCTTVNCNDCPADMNSDGSVDIKDLLLLIGAWGVCP